MTTDAPDARPPRELGGSGSSWNRRRLAADLSITELGRLSGLPRSVVGLIDQGRMVPTPDEAAAILRVLEARR